MAKKKKKSTVHEVVIYESKKEEKKAQFLEVLVEVYGNRTSACAFMGITRQCVYKWCAESPEYEKLVEAAALEGKIHQGDAYERALDRKALFEGDTTAIIFALKTKHKHLGYVESKDININQKNILEINETDAAIFAAIAGGEIIEHDAH